MTNNHDDFENQVEEHDINAGAEAGLEGHDGTRSHAGGRLTEAWRTKPLFKLLILMTAVGAVIAAGASFLGGGGNNNISKLAAPPAMKEAPGGPVSPYMKQQTELADKQRIDKALATGGSALITPIGQNNDVGGLDALDKKNDPLTELRAETERLKQQVQKQQQQSPAQIQAQQKAQEQFDNTLAQAMQQQMKQLMESWAPKGIKEVAGSAEKADKAAAANAAAGTAGVPGQVVPASAVQIKPKPVVPAGTVSYAQLLTEANSDVPGPILAQIVSGPLAGARAIGAFQVANSYDEYLVMTFSLASLKGKEYQVNAIALDPNTTLGGMATEVDERYFTRVVLPAAASFLQGLGQALGQGNNSITTNGSTTITTQANQGFKQGMYTGLGQAGQTAGQFFQNQANVTKPLVRVAAGTPVGLFFVASVQDPDAAATAAAANADAVNGTTQVSPFNAGMNAAAGGYNRAPYPGTTVAGYGMVPGMGNPNAANTPYPNSAMPNYGYNTNRIGQNPYGSMPGAVPGYGYGAGSGYGMQ